MKQQQYSVGIIYEHPEWHQPLFDALKKEGVSFVKIDLKKCAFRYDDIPEADVYYNMVSPSAYVRGNQRAVPMAFALCRNLEYHGKTVLNGSASMALELSKSSQVALMSSLGIDHPNSIVFNDVDSLRQYEGQLHFPMLLKPEQGGSGARMFLVNSLEELRRLLEDQPGLWLPDNLMLLQELLPYDMKKGIVRVEFVGGEFLYAMRVITNGAFNLCPSVVCNPEDGNGHCEITVPGVLPMKPEFYPCLEVSAETLSNAQRIMKASGHATGSLEYLETEDGRTVFYDINANSNLRESIGHAFGIKPFEVVVRYLRKRAHEARSKSMPRFSKARIRISKSAQRRPRS